MSGGKQQGVVATPLQKAQAGVAAQQWQDYQNRWLPVQNYYKNRLSQTGQKDTVARGLANTAVQQGFGKADEQMEAGLAGRRVGLGSGKQLMAQAQLAGQKGAAAGQGMSATSGAVEQQYESGLQDIIARARGQQSTSDQAFGDVARNSGEIARQQAENSALEAAGTGEAIGTGLGMAAYGGFRSLGAGRLPYGGAVTADSPLGQADPTVVGLR